MTAPRPRPDIVRLIRAGHSNRAIAEQLRCGRATVARVRAELDTCRHGHPRKGNTGMRRDGSHFCTLCRKAAGERKWQQRFEDRHPGHPTTSGPAGRRWCLICKRVSPIDESAVERAAAGDPPARLNPAERQAAVLRLRRQQLSGTEIARRIGCTDRTVWRVLSRTRAQQLGQAA